MKYAQLRLLYEGRLFTSNTILPIFIKKSTKFNNWCIITVCSNGKKRMVEIASNYQTARRRYKYLLDRTDSVILRCSSLLSEKLVLDPWFEGEYEYRKYF